MTNTSPIELFSVARVQEASSTGSMNQEVVMEERCRVILYVLQICNTIYDILDFFSCQIRLAGWIDDTRL